MLETENSFSSKKWEDAERFHSDVYVVDMSAQKVYQIVRHMFKKYQKEEDKDSGKERFHKKYNKQLKEARSYYREIRDAREGRAKEQ